MYLDTVDVDDTHSSIHNFHEFKFMYFHASSYQNLLSSSSNLTHIKEGSEEKDDVVKDDLKQKQDFKKDPKKGLLSNGVSVSVRGWNDKFREIFLVKSDV